jgi:hypothetical protein
MQLQVNEDQSDFEMIFLDNTLDEKDSQIDELKKQLIQK